MPDSSDFSAFRTGSAAASRYFTDIGDSTVGFIKEQTNDFMGGWNEATKSVLPQAQRARKPELVFPRDMLVESQRPYIRFTCKPANGGQAMTSVNLPCPGGVGFNDGGDYTTVDMGIIGDIASIVAKGGSVSEMAGAAAGAFKKQSAGLGAVGGGILALKTLGADNAATALEFANKSVRNPRTNTAFSGNQLRNFQFEFKMIGKDPNEVDEINEIQSFFREQVYASKLNGTSTIMQQYPSQWTVKFIDPRDGNELQYMPKIFTCYLTSANTTINSTSNTFRTDLSPYEVDVSLGFQETKVLDRDEINALEGGVRFNRDDDAYNELNSQIDNLTNAAQQMMNRKETEAQARESRNNETQTP